MTTVEVLHAARELYATNPSHVPYPETPAYGTYCAVTAISHSAMRLWSGGLYDNAREALARATGNPPWVSIPRWNAEHSTEEVLAAFDEAIANEEAKAQEFTVEQVPQAA